MEGPDSGWTVVIADDHPLVRDAMRHALNQSLSDVQVVDASSLDEARQAVDRLGTVDLVILDLNMPGMDGFTGLASMRAAYPLVPVAMVSATNDETVMRRAIEFGAAGFIPKSAPLDTIAEAIGQILEGQVWLPAGTGDSAGGASRQDIARRLGELTPQQLKVLSMMSQGLLNKQIAYELGVGEATVKAHVTAILKKLGVHSRTQAVIAARLLDFKTAG
ncbi:response regulator transcription factor [Zavarzinia compransoris]|uniref:DNA-binding response regulator n=1 Tax=Zavarzinia compransoris TaxID=1264899 RepID=A0A317E9W8_9PROT|nr:response regulator transcription factor [Zavarzinia compransoris]PWR23501.1 DNA-binding response regulator [Zavarzinia compransoris]TDP47712.1 LuxR family two component transcriptional regulator [Zavarzinia compransoris]